MKKELLLTAAIAGLIAGSATMNPALAGKAKKVEGKFKCLGGNTCKSKGACGSADGSSACKGSNACKGKGFTFTADEAECKKLTKAE